MSDTPAPAASATPSASPAPYVSLTLTVLPPERRPAEQTVCETCHAALWHASKDELRCYCRAMRLISWSSEEP